MANEEKILIARSMDISLMQDHPVADAIVILQDALKRVEKENGVDATLCCTVHYDEYEYAIEYKSPETTAEQNRRLNQIAETEQRKQRRDKQEYERLKKLFG